jgi:hypothetical protein
MKSICNFGYARTKKGRSHLDTSSEMAIPQVTVGQG